MDDSRYFGLLLNNCNAYRKHSREYSRHLCDFTRSAVLLGDKRSSQVKVSDSEAITLHKRHLTIGRSASTVTPRQRNVYTLDKTFHRKFGHKGRQEEGLHYSGLALIANRKQTPGNPHFSGSDEGEKTFCDSVSSFPCSGNVNTRVEKRLQKLDGELPTRHEKHEAIERWLDCLPKLPITY